MIGAAAFFAPNPPNFDFLAGAAPTPAALLPVDAFEDAAEDVNLDAPSLDAGREAEPREEFDRIEAELIVRGAEADRPITGGAAGVDGVDDDADLVVGLSQEEKKSSSSWAEVGVGGISPIPSTMILSGNLRMRKARIGLSWYEEGRYGRGCEKGVRRTLRCLL